MAIRYGAHALGLVGHMPSGPGVIDDVLIAEIVKHVPPGVSTFLLTSETTAVGIKAHHQHVQTSCIQMVDHVSYDQLTIIRAALPSVKLVQVIHVIDESSIHDALDLTPYVDALLLDSGRPNAAIRELGGTGRKHDWSLSQRIVQLSSKPVFLAGGLRPDNAKEAIDSVRPFGLDVCSGLRTNGLLDEDKVAKWSEALNKN
jgi:phosphoribosylanthranilate isomerase